MKNYSLNGTWDLYFFKQGSKDIKVPADLKNADVTKIPATVPGNVELDLSKAGFLPEDLYMGTNIEKVQDYELYEWWYETEFDAPGLDEKETAFLKFDAVDCFSGGQTAVTDGGVHLVQRIETEFSQRVGKNVAGCDGGESQTGALQFGFKHGSTGGDIFFTAFFLEPLADLVARLVGFADLHPVAAGALGVFGGNDLHDVTVFQLAVKGDDAAVNFGGCHAVADGRVNGVGKVDGGGAGG